MAPLSFQWGSVGAGQVLVSVQRNIVTNTLYDDYHCSHHPSHLLARDGVPPLRPDPLFVVLSAYFGGSAFGKW